MKKKTDWAALVDAFEGSGFTHAEFCAKHNVALSSFKNHLYDLRKQRVSANGFTQIAVSAGERASTGVELHFPDGMFLRFAGDVAPGYLRDLIVGLRP